LVDQLGQCDFLWMPSEAVNCRQEVTCIQAIAL
jgi:hypothetical protein